MLPDEIAASLDADPALLPFLPQLLTDFDVLSTEPDDVLALLRPLGLPAGLRVLDVGCGKGVVAVALAEALGAQVVGVDGVSAFIDVARRRAEAAGVAARCRFVVGDLRALLAPAEPFDVLVFGGLGPVLGRLDETVRQLRAAVRPGGYLVIDDAFLKDPAVVPAGYEAYAGRAEMRRRLTAHGDEILAERIFDAEALHDLSQQQLTGIRRQAEALARAHPEHAARFEDYVRRQAREVEIMETDAVCALWLVRRASSQ